MTGATALLLAGYTLPDLAAVQGVLRRTPALTHTLCVLGCILADYFPHAPLVLHVDGAGLYLCIGVGDVERALAGPLATFDREWWQQQPVGLRRQVTIDVECTRHGR